RVVRLELAEGARRGIGEAFGEAIVLRDRLPVEVAVHLRRVVDELLRERRPNDAFGLVGLGERLRQSVLRFQQPVLDDQVLAMLVDEVTDLVPVDRHDLVFVVHCTSLSTLSRGNTSTPTRVRPKTTAW